MGEAPENDINEKAKILWKMAIGVATTLVAIHQLSKLSRKTRKKR